MSVFDGSLMQSFGQGDQSAHEQVHGVISALHKRLFEMLAFNHLDLHLVSAREDAVRYLTVADPDVDLCMSVNYMRQRAQAVTVERLMGREEIASANTIEARRHPVIELRLTPDFYVIELLMSRDAWWDQQNLVGKLTVERHKQHFYEQLRALDERYILGFWKGAHLSEMHLSARYFYHTRIMDQWLDTFEPGADWFRLGIWYEPDDDALTDNDHLIEATYEQIRALYEIYDHLRWSSDNNFRDFYNGR